jgi:hypothetical protein
MASHTATIRWRGGRELAEVLLAAISPDDPGTFEARLEACAGEDDEVVLVIETASDSIGSVRATLDDLLSCLAAAESAVLAIDDE